MEYREMKAKLPVGENRVSARLYREGNEIYGSLVNGETVRLVPTGVTESGRTTGWRIETKGD